MRRQRRHFAIALTGLIAAAGCNRDSAPAEPEPGALAAPTASKTLPDEAPAKADETPAKKDETPAKADGTPAKKNETPAKKDEPPAKTDEAPAKADKAPAGACATLDRAECLGSTSCTLHWVSNGTYQCLKARGPCEENLVQGDRTGCETRSDCAWDGGSCYCPFPGYGRTQVEDKEKNSGGACACGGGAPPLCRAEK